MTEKYNDATANRPEGTRIIDAPAVMIDLPQYIRQIKSENAWLKNDRNSITVFKTGEMCMVLGALHKNAQMLPHRAQGVMSLLVIEGQLQSNTETLTTTLFPGQAIVLHKGCNYQLLAAEETVYLLTITGVYNNSGQDEQGGPYISG